MWGVATIPAGWLVCDGTGYATTAYPALYDVIGTTFGSSGGFQVPDLRGRVPYGVSSSPSRPLNTKDGSTIHYLTATESALRSHTHGYGDYYNDTSAQTCNAASGAGSNKNQTTGNESTNSVSAAAASPHNNVQPYIVVNFIIKT